MDRLAKGARISGASREDVAAQFAEGYLAGASIRALAAGSGRSYGFVQTLLGEAGVELRSRGGARRHVSASTTKATSDSTDGSRQLPVLSSVSDGESHHGGHGHKAKKERKSAKKKDRSGKKERKSAKKKDKAKSKKK